MFDQRQYLHRSLEELKIDTQKNQDTPLSPSFKIDLKKNPGKATATELYNFQRLVGKYNFAACTVRCDISQSTSQMARFMCNPSPKHYQHALRIPRYLATCLDRCLVYRRDHRHISEFGSYGLHCALDSNLVQKSNCQVLEGKTLIQ